VIIKAVVFDFDGTLYPNYQMLLYGVPIFLKSPRFVREFGKLRKQLRLHPPYVNLHKAQARMMHRKFNLSKDCMEKRIERIIYEKWPQSIKHVRPFAHLDTLLSKLNGLEFKIGILSDLPVVKKLEYFKLKFPWHFIFSSEESGTLKPNPEAFNIVIDYLSLPPEEILYVGNNYEYDIVGAHNVGMKTAHISKRKNENSFADYTFYKYTDLESWLLNSYNSR
jgi:putative hydrolase of the HAD superfamily